MSAAATTRYLPFSHMQSGRDDYTTPLCEWMKLKPMVPEGLRIWDPFYHDGKATEYLQTAFSPESVHHDDHMIDLEAPDPFDASMPRREDVDLILTNTPFSRKDSALQWLIRTEIPFIALVPFHTVTKKSFLNDIIVGRDIEDLQIVIVSGRIRFEKTDGESMPRTASFPCVWVARGLEGLQRRHRHSIERRVYNIKTTYV